MNKTDLVFYLTSASVVWINIQQQLHALISNTAFAWFNILMISIGTLAYLLYENINGQPPTPPAPTS